MQGSPPPENAQLSAVSDDHATVEQAVSPTVTSAAGYRQDPSDRQDSLPKLAPKRARAGWPVEGPVEKEREARMGAS